MKREFEFFIMEKCVQELARERKSEGAILVGSANELFSYLWIHTEPRDDICCKISGAWLDQCVENSVLGLLYLESQPNNHLRMRVSQIIVDLSICVAFYERNGAFSIEERRNLLTDRLGELVHDPRLVILPNIPNDIKGNQREQD